MTEQTPNPFSEAQDWIVITSNQEATDAALRVAMQTAEEGLRIRPLCPEALDSSTPEAADAAFQLAVFRVGATAARGGRTFVVNATPDVMSYFDAARAAFCPRYTPRHANQELPDEWPRSV